MSRARVSSLSALTLLLVVVLAACSSAAPKGSLKVTVNGLPSGVAGEVMVTGPGGYSQTVTSTTTLSVPAGSYSVTAGAASNGNTIVPTLYDGSVSTSSVAVTANATSSTTATYAVRPGTGHVWVPMNGGSLEAESYPASALKASGSPAPDVTLAGTNNQAESVAFDGSGNLWVGDGAGYVYRYDASDLASSGTPAPAVTIDATAYGFVNGVAFDASGNLWAADGSSSQLLMYTPAQQSTGGALTPQVVLSATGSPASIAHPVGIAFDAAGDLWVANLNNNTIVEFAPAQLTATASPAPTVTLSSTSISSPFGIAFDASGNLWVGNDVGTVLRFDAGQLTTTGGPTPAASLASSAVGSNPDGVTFDASGALWVGDYNGGGSAILRRFTNPDALTGSGLTPAPDVTLSSVGATDVPEVAFDPPPANLPIQTP